MNSEEFSGLYLKKKFGLGEDIIEAYEDVVRNGQASRFDALNAMSDVRGFHTPDYVISDNAGDALEDLLFVDISGPKGGLLTITEIALDKEIARVQKSMVVGQTRSVELSKQVKPLISGCRSKLIKINNKYALNRDLKKSVSSCNGIVYCMEGERVPQHHVNTTHDLGAYQLIITVLELLDLLSGGLCQLSDIEKLGLNKPVKFKFVKPYQNISFVCFVGQATMVNQSYIFVNSDFLETSQNVIVKSFNKLGCIDGNSFRAVRCAKSRQFLDIHLAEINEKNPHVFPFGNVNYRGDTCPTTGVKLHPLDLTELTEVNQEFDKGFRR